MSDDTMTPTPITDEGIAQAREMVGLYYEAEVRLSERRLELSARIPEARKVAGQKALAAMMSTAKPAGAKDGLLALQAELEGVDAAIEEARARRAEQIKATFGFEALQIQDRAAEIRRDVKDRQAVTAAMLDRLREHEGVPYEPGWAVSAMGGRGQYIPKTEQLRLRAVELEQRSSHLNERRVPAAGTVTDAASRDDLLARIRAYDPMVLAPRLDHVAEWADAAVSGLQARLEQLADRQEADGAEILLTCGWRDGTIDPRESFARIRVPERPAPPAPRLAVRSALDGDIKITSLAPAS